MKGFQISTVWILCLATAFLSQQIETVSAVYSMNQTCAQYGTGHIADPSSCESFGYCKNGQLMGTESCPNGYVYNSRRNVCDVPSPEACAIANVTYICKYAPEGSFVADSTNCKRFCNCKNKVALCNECPNGQIFDSKKTRCVWSSESTTKCVADSICRLVPDGKFIGDPAFCGQYQICSNGLGTPGQCPKNMYFNKENGMCQYDNPCTGPTPSGIGPGVAKPLPSNADVCKTAKAPFPQYVGDGKTCMGYYVCTSADGPGSWNKCDAGLHFNEEKCVTPYSFACTYDRCGNINQQFVAAVGSQCHNYLICKNETSQPQSSGYANYVGLPCAHNQYFNEFTQTCDDKSPASATYKLCPKTNNV